MVQAEHAKVERLRFGPIERVSVDEGEYLQTIASGSRRIADMEKAIAKDAHMKPIDVVKSDGTYKAPVDRLDYLLVQEGVSVRVSVLDNGAFGVAVRSEVYDLKDSGSQSSFDDRARRGLMYKLIDALERE